MTLFLHFQKTDEATSGKVKKEKGHKKSKKNGKNYAISQRLILYNHAMPCICIVPVFLSSAGFQKIYLVCFKPLPDFFMQ